MTVTTAKGQTDDEIMANAREVFYGSRLKKGTVLLTGFGSFENTTIANSVFAGGLNLGVAVNSHVSIHAQAETADNPNPAFFGIEGNARRSNTFGAGVRVRSKAVFGGIVQLYTGIGYSRTGLRNYRSAGADPSPNNLTVHRIVVPLGFDVWLSTFAGLSVEPFTLGINSTGPGNDAIDGTEVDLFSSTFSPSIGITFLINSRKPDEQ